VGDAKPTKITPSDIRCQYLSVSGDQVVWMERDDSSGKERVMTWRPGQAAPLQLMEDEN